MKPTTILFASSLLLLSISPIAHAEETKSLADTLASEAKETQMKDQAEAGEENTDEEEAENEPVVTANTLSNREVDNLADQVTTDLEQLLSGKKKEEVKKEDVEKVVEKAKEQGKSSDDIQKAVLEALDELQEKGVDVKQETLSFAQESITDILSAGSEDAMGDPASIYIQSLNAELAGTKVAKASKEEEATAKDGNKAASTAPVAGEGSEESVDVDKVTAAIATNLASNKTAQEVDESKEEEKEAVTTAANTETEQAEAQTEAALAVAQSDNKATEEDKTPAAETAPKTEKAFAKVDGNKLADNIAKTVDGEISMDTQKGPKGTITVVHGESLSNIAERIYGETKYYQVIFDANRDVLADPNMVKVGQILKIPPKPE
jgi:nucleoid-associated protein YgaU